MHCEFNSGVWAFFPTNDHLCSYQTAEYTPRSLVHIPAPLAWNGQPLNRWLMEHVRVVSSERDIDPSTDLFAQGFDRRVMT